MRLSHHTHATDLAGQFAELVARVHRQGDRIVRTVQEELRNLSDLPAGIEHVARSLETSHGDQVTSICQLKGGLAQVTGTLKKAIKANDEKIEGAN
jgi:hypothetical protein